MVRGVRVGTNAKGEGLDYAVVTVAGHASLAALLGLARTRRLVLPGRGGQGGSSSRPLSAR